MCNFCVSRIRPLLGPCRWTSLPVRWVLRLPVQFQSDRKFYFLWVAENNRSFFVQGSQARFLWNICRSTGLEPPKRAAWPVPSRRRSLLWVLRYALRRLNDSRLTQETSKKSASYPVIVNLILSKKTCSSWTTESSLFGSPQHSLKERYAQTHSPMASGKDWLDGLLRTSVWG